MKRFLSVLLVMVIVLPCFAGKAKKPKKSKKASKPKNELTESVTDVDEVYESDDVFFDDTEIITREQIDSMFSIADQLNADMHEAIENGSNEDLDYFFVKLKENDCEKLISEYGDMDTQSTLVKEFIKRGLIFKIIPKFLFKKVGNIFGFR